MNASSPLPSTRGENRLIALSRASFTVAILFAAAACVPRDWLYPLGAMIGRPNAITVDVHFRATLVSWAFAAAAAGIGLIAAWQPQRLLEFTRDWREERRQPRGPFDSGWWWVVGIAIVGGVIRGVHLQTPMAYDEAYTFLNYARKSAVEAIADYDSTNNHLLNTWEMHWLYVIGGPHEAVLRLGVYATGVLLIPATYAWAKTWTDRSSALLATVLVAIAPALITYSYDARGYIYVCLAAVSLDLACRQLMADTNRPRHWVAVGLIAAVLGLWAMPIMLYAIIGSCGAALLQQWLMGKLSRQRLAVWLTTSGIAGFLVFGLYAPAFVYRGLMFLRDPIMTQSAQTNYLSAAGASWFGAWEWWTAGVMPPAVWAMLILAGLVAWTIQRRSPWMWGLPFLAVAAINGMKLSTPPPRIYLFLLPWIALAAAHGAMALLRWCRCPAPIRGVLSAALLVVGSIAAVRSPVLIYPEERFAFLDVPAVVAAMHEDLADQPGAPARLLSPLPVDYPTRFYLERRSSPVAMNGQPQPGELVYVIVPEGSLVGETLRKPPITLDDDRLDDAEWVSVAVPAQTDHPVNLTLLRMRGTIAGE